VKFVLLCSTGLYVIAILFDIAFLQTGILGYKYAYWISLSLASVGSVYYSVVRIIKGQGDGLREP
jgi:hypothetical protein